MDFQKAAQLQIVAVQRCEDPTPIPAEEGRKMLGLFSSNSAARSPTEIDILAARVALDQSVRLEESNGRLQESNERFSARLILLTWVLIALTVVLIVVGLVPLLKHESVWPVYVQFVWLFSVTGLVVMFTT